MSSRRETQGLTVAAIGAATLAASLWLPWYSFRIPAAAIDSAEQFARQLGALGPLVTAGAKLASQLGPLHLTAWHALSTTPGVVLAVAVIAGGLSVLELTGRATSVARPTALAGIVGVALVGYRILDHPGGGFLHPAWGIYLALVGAIAIVAGGVIAGQESTVGSDWSTASPGWSASGPGWSTGGSSPPNG
jgi:hypothetical protein